MVQIGYARTSTIAQTAAFEAQVRELEAAGCEKVFRDRVSLVAKRGQLAIALDFIREGDTLVVTKLDRFARSTQHLLEIAEVVKGKGANLQELNLNLDTDSATGKLMFTMIAAVAEFERAMMLERQREGIAKAKAAQVRGCGQGFGPTTIAKQLGIGRASVCRVLAPEERTLGVQRSPGPWA